MPDGTCPRCRTQVDKGALALDADQRVAEARAHATIPWHFWLMVAAAAVYLGWRAIQGLLALF